MSSGILANGILPSAGDTKYVLFSHVIASYLVGLLCAGGNVTRSTEVGFDGFALFINRAAEVHPLTAYFEVKLHDIPSSGIFRVVDSRRCSEPMKWGSRSCTTRNITVNQFGCVSNKCGMIERYFSQAKLLIRLRTGPIGPYL
jgi:hypothetical protein